MASQIILLLIVLASSLVGTFLSPQPWAKGCIAALSVAATVAAIFKAYEEYTGTEFIKGALAAELASSKPTPAFQKAFVRSFNRVAAAKGMRVYKQMIKDEGTLTILVTQHTDAEAGAVRFNLDSLGQAYVHFVSKKPIDPVLSRAMYTVPAAKNEDSMADILDELGFVGKVAVDQSAAWLSANSTFTRNYRYDPPEVTVDAIEGSRTIHTVLDSEFISSIIDMPPYARNWKAYSEFQRQVRLTHPAPPSPFISTGITY